MSRIRSRVVIPTVGYATRLWLTARRWPSKQRRRTPATAVNETLPDRRERIMKGVHFGAGGDRLGAGSKPGGVGRAAGVPDKPPNLGHLGTMKPEASASADASHSKCASSPDAPQRRVRRCSLCL